MSLLCRWKLWLAVVAIFTAGCIVGGVVTHRAVVRLHQERSEQRNWTPRTLHWLAREGGLSQTQAEGLRPVVEAAMLELAGLRDRAAGERREILVRMLAASADGLEPGQRERIRQAFAALGSARGGSSGLDSRAP